MANEQFNIRLSPEVINMINGLCVTERGKIERGALIEALVRKEWAALKLPAKRIEPVYEMIGKRKKLVGFDAWYGDDLIDTRDTLAAAEDALNAYVFEELSK